MILSISEKELCARGGFCVKTVDEAMGMYESAVITAEDKRDLFQFLKKVMDRNPGSAYADFYYAALKPDQQLVFTEGLREDEKKVLAEFEAVKKQVYYQIDEKALQFLFGITARNWLFSTFYFTDKKIMVWGNYDLKFPVFCEDTETLTYYMKLAKDCGLECQR